MDLVKPSMKVLKVEIQISLDCESRENEERTLELNVCRKWSKVRDFERSVFRDVSSGQRSVSSKVGQVQSGEDYTL